MFCMLARNRTIRKPHQCQLSTNPMAGNAVRELPRNATSKPGTPRSVNSAGIPRSGLSNPRQSAAVTTLGKSRLVVIIIVASLFTPIVARTVRSAVSAEADLDYVRMRYVPYGGPAVVPKWLWAKPERPRVALTMGLTATEVYVGLTTERADRPAFSPADAATELRQLETQGVLEPRATYAVLVAAGHGEGETRPRVMGFGIHPFLTGQRYRAKHLRTALDHMVKHRDDVWFHVRRDCVARSVFAFAAAEMDFHHLGVLKPTAVRGDV